MMNTPRGGRKGASAVSRAADWACSSRFNMVFALFAVAALVFFCRLFFLQVIVADEYSAQAAESRTASYPIHAKRGTIYDRNGIVLATSVDAVTIYADPREVTDPQSTAVVLASVLGGTSGDYLDALTKKDTSFAYIKRQADVEDGDALREKGLAGIYFIEDTRREYPNAEVGGQIVGCCDWDGNGLTGLELQYDEILRGTDGEYRAERGRKGMPMPGGIQEDRRPVEGRDIMVSIDIKLQDAVERAVAAGAEELKTDEGSAVVMDASTGEIFAACSLPYMDPGDMSHAKAGSDQLKAITQAFEPGSIFKTVSALTVLENNTLTPEDELYCPAELEADGYVVSDSHERGDATFTFREILDQSSNIGISLAVQKTGFDKLYDNIIQYKFGEQTGVDYPGEAPGTIQPFENWARITGYNVSFGQGIAATPLQMVRFYGAVANGGTAVSPHFLMSLPQSDEYPQYDTEQVVDNPEALVPLRSMLRTVVTDGTGKDADIDGYEVVGKTSTAEIASSEGGYVKETYNLCFTGFIDNSSSDLVCFVSAGNVNGMAQVTRTFHDIMSYAVDLYNISPE